MSIVNGGSYRRPPVTHPLIPDTLAYFGDMTEKLVLTHLNHTNPVLDEASEERAMVYRRGATVARQGQVFSLADPSEVFLDS